MRKQFDGFGKKPDALVIALNGPLQQTLEDTGNSMLEIAALCYLIGLRGKQLMGP